MVPMAELQPRAGAVEASFREMHRLDRPKVWFLTPTTVAVQRGQPVSFMVKARRIDTKKAVAEVSRLQVLTTHPKVLLPEGCEKLWQGANSKISSYFGAWEVTDDGRQDSEDANVTITWSNGTTAPNKAKLQFIRKAELCSLLLYVLTGVTYCNGGAAEASGMHRAERPWYQSPKH